MKPAELTSLAAATYAGFHGDEPSREQRTRGTLRNAYWQGRKARLEGRGCGCPRCGE